MGEYYFCSDNLEKEMAFWIIEKRDLIIQLCEIFRGCFDSIDKNIHIYILFKLLCFRYIKMEEEVIENKIINSVTEENKIKIKGLGVGFETDKHIFLKCLIIKKLEKDDQSWDVEVDAIKTPRKTNFRFDVATKDNKIAIECGMTTVNRFYEGLIEYEELWYLPYPKRGENYTIYKFKKGDSLTNEQYEKEYNKYRTFNDNKIKSITENLKGKW